MPGSGTTWMVTGSDTFRRRLPADDPMLWVDPLRMRSHTAFDMRSMENWPTTSPTTETLSTVPVVMTRL